MPATGREAGYNTTTRTTAVTGAEEMRSSIFRRPISPRARAERRNQGDVPWLSTVKLPWGVEARVLNISSTGLLFESGSKLNPGHVTVKLCGPDSELVLQVCFVRSEVAVVDHLGVKYHTAVTFEQPLTLLEPPAIECEPSPTMALSDLLIQVSAALARSAPSSLRTALERGVRQALTARDVQIRDVPIVLDDRTASICVTIPKGSGSPSILLALFAPGYAPTAVQLKLLKAAAGLAAVVLEFEEGL